MNTLPSLSYTAARVYETIVKRFLSIFYPAAKYRKVGLTFKINTEFFFTNIRVLEEEGYLKVVGNKDKGKPSSYINGTAQERSRRRGREFRSFLIEIIMKLKKGMFLPVQSLTIKEGETSPPKRYSSGSLILAMENAGQLIEDEELRAQIKGSGIGTSATRAEILNKLVKIEYLKLNKKTQIITPTLLGEMIYEVVNASIKSLLNPELTASWEKGLTYVANGEISSEEYTEKLERFVSRMVEGVKALNNQQILKQYFYEAAKHYKS